MSETWPSQWFDLPLAVFDLETTGKDTGTCKIIEVGISKFYHGELVQQLDWFVDPECTIPQEVVELTHIQQSDVDGQPKLREIASEILEAFKGHGIVAYNIGFDRTVLTREFQECGFEWPKENPIIDPLVFASHFYPNQRNKLGIVCERLNITLEGAHRACNDAEATGKVLYAFRDRLPPDLESLLIVQAQWERENIERMQWRRSGHDDPVQSFVVQQSSSKGLGPAFFFGNETDPLRAVYSTVPAARPRTTNND